MRNSTLRRFLLFLLLLPTYLCTTAWAQLSTLEQGKVYRFVNVGQSSYALAATTTKGATGITATSTSTKADYPQLWYVAEVKNANGTSTYRLRNMGNGLYLQGNGTSTQWKMVDGGTTANTYLYLITRDAHNTLSDQSTTGGYRHMHLDGSRNVVGWVSANQSTQWDITQVDIAADVIAQNWTNLESVTFSEAQIKRYQTALDALFTDKACTTLSTTYASMSETDLKAHAHYTALPEALKNMVYKTWRTQNGTSVNEAWQESNFDTKKPAWGGDYAKRFRIQNYEIYTERECANSAMQINIHTNLNNPTGIFGNYRQPLFVMVENEVPENASLYLGYYTGHGQGAGYKDGVQLHQGLNVIPFWGDKTWTCIYYTAKTMKAWDGTTTLTDFDLTQFPDMKIHIEGGNVNGYYNAVGDDLWAHNAATAGCDENHNVATVATQLTKADGTLTAANDNLLQSNNIYPKGDNEADWDYLAARNVLDDLTIVGRYMVYQFCFNSPEAAKPEYCTDYWFTKPSDGTRRVRIADVLERWDRIMMSQRLTMGLLSKQEVEEANARFHAWDATKHDIYTFPGESDEITKDYSKHYRMHGLAITMNTGYMSGGWTSSNYHYNTLPGIIGTDMVDENSAGGATWGPGHEIGHQHQKPINMNGLTEVTNNMFANIAVWYDGRGTSRMNSGQGDLSSVLNAYNQEGYDFFSNNIWAQTHLYYKLWLYYHLVGKNKNFLPRLFELLRRDRMEISYNQEGSKSLLHFYKKACDAAQEDLTEFFRAYGFFTVMKNRFVGDYSNSEYTQTQADIDAAIQYVKAKNYPENLQVLFINDTDEGGNYVKHDGTTPRVNWEGTNHYSDLGAYTDFQGTTSSPVTGDYALTVNNGVATATGATGGVGFLIYDASGNLLSFSSDYSFPVSQAAQLAIAKGTAVVKAMNADGTTQKVAYDATSAATSQLQTALNKASAMLALTDDGGAGATKDYTKPGFYKGELMGDVQTCYNKALAIFNNGQTVSYLTAAQALDKACQTVLDKAFAKVEFIPGSTCTLRNYAYPTRYMTETTRTDNGVTSNIISTKVVTDEASLTNNEQWIVEATATAGVFYLKNKATGRYAQSVSAQSTIYGMGDSQNSFLLDDMGNGRWAFSYNSNHAWGLHSADSKSYHVVGWNHDADASQWYIVMTEKDEIVSAENQLEALIAQTRTLVDEMAIVGLKGDMDMANMRIYSNTPEQYHGTEMLVDGNPETFFHTNWTGDNAVAEDHYILFDCDAMPLDEFAVRYTTLPTSASNVDAPKTIVIEGANEAVNGIPSAYTTIATLSSTDANPLPTAKATSYTSATLGTAGTSYRYIRLRVTDATGGTWGTHKYFGLAELTLVRQADKVFGIKSKYSSLTEGNITDALNAITDAETAIAGEDKTASSLQTAYTALEAKYNVLAAAKASGETSETSPYRTALETLISSTNTLISECGTVTDISANFPLQSTSRDAAGYLYCNAPYTAQSNGDYSVQGTDGYHLLDGDLSTFLHTDYSGTNSPDDVDHYLRVYCGEKGLDYFTFTYTTRNTGDGQPTSMVVEGCNEEAGTYTTLAELTGLPTGHSVQYTSEAIGTRGQYYKYLRFRVTGNSKNEPKGGHYWFCMAEFGVQRVPIYEAAVNENCGVVEESDILATYEAVKAAQTVLDMATTVEELEAGTAALQAQYNALNSAKNTSPADFTALNAVISSTQTSYASCFSDEACTTIKSEYASSLNLTAALLAEVKAALEAAQTVANTRKATQAQVDEQTALLTAKANQLAHAIAAAAYPVKLTFNVEAPELYSITMKVADGSRLQYRGDASHGDGSDSDYDKIKRASQLELGNAYQAFYFVPGSVAGQVRLYNYADNKFFGATEYAAGPGKVKAYGESAADLKVKEWKIVANANNPDWYNLQTVPTDGSTTVYYMGQSNDDGTPNLGFRDDADSERALYKFQQDNGMHLSAAYIQLYNYFHSSLKTSAAIELANTSDNVGFISTEKATAFNEALAAAQTQLANETDTDEAYTAAYTALVSANEALVVNLPVEGKYYVIRSAATNGDTDYCRNALVHANTDTHKLTWTKGKSATDATAIWSFTPQDDGTFILKNLHTQTGPGSLPFQSGTAALQESSLPVTISSFDFKAGSLTLSIGGENMHAQQTDNCIVQWPVASGNASLWKIEEVTESDLSAVGYSLSMSKWENASFFSAYPVTVPDGLKAYYLKGEESLNASSGTATLTEITGGVIPAGTGVILRGVQGSYTLSFANEAWSQEAPADNLLKGSPYKCFKAGEAGRSYYVFGVKDSHVGLYKAYLEYDANGTQGTNNEYNDTNDGGYFLVEANRIYMESADAQAQPAGFHLADPELTGLGTTELGTDGKDAVIFDLQGRRLLRVTTPGFYLINGQKRFVRPSEK